jgi:hypothetical protein
MSKHPWPWRYEITAPDEPIGNVYAADGNRVLLIVTPVEWAAIVAMRAEAYAAGQEAMRKQCVAWCEEEQRRGKAAEKYSQSDFLNRDDVTADVAEEFAEAIRALPLQPETETKL